MTENKKIRVKKIQKLFVLGVLKGTLLYSAFMVFAFCVGVLLLDNALLDGETMTFYVVVSAWIFFLGCSTDLSEQYDIMKKDIEVVLITNKEDDSDDEK